MQFCQFIELIAPLAKESINKRLEAGFCTRGRKKRMTNDGNQEQAEIGGQDLLGGRYLNHLQNPSTFGRQ